MTGRAAAPITSWIGGKRYAGKRILAAVQAVPHSAYAEPFVGMGGVILRRRPPTGVTEIVNDIHIEIVTLLRCARDHADELVRHVEAAIGASRDEFELLLRTPPDTMTDIRRAARFVTMMNTSWGGRPPRRPGDFGGWSKGCRSPVLRDVWIERLPWPEFVARYDRPHTLFYLDPPYPGAEDAYGDAFSTADWDALADALLGLKGKFLLSLPAGPVADENFAWCGRREIRLAQLSSRDGTKARLDLLLHSPGIELPDLDARRLAPKKNFQPPLRPRNARA